MVDTCLHLAVKKMSLLDYPSADYDNNIFIVKYLLQNGAKVEPGVKAFAIEFLMMIYNKGYESFTSIRVFSRTKRYQAKI